MDDSDSDDFFDARQDITSPRCPSSPILVSVDDAFENNLQSSNPNSPSRLGGDLSLAHLLQENASNVSVVTVENDKSPADNEPFQHHTSVQEKPGTDELGEDCGVDKQRGDDQKLETISQTSSSKPDLVACIQERPIDLPGVQPVMVESIDVSQPKKSTYQPPPKTHLSLPRPNRPPPPRPKEPPKRPPPPKSAPPAKLTFGHGDDNLLTPNTTVDNITKEFADALKDDLQRTKSTSSSSQNDTTQPKPRKNFMSSLTKRYSSKDSLTSEKHSKNIAAVTSTSLQLSPEKPPSPTFSPTVPAPSEPQPPAQPGPSNLEETRTWSELSKSSVLRIDSTPPLEILSTVIVRNLDTGQTMPLSVAAEQVSQCLNPLALQIMSRTKEFSYPGGPQEDPPTPTTSAPPDPSQQLFRSDEETLSVASDDITIGGDAVRGSKPAEGSSGSGGGGKLRVKSKRFKRILGKGARKVKAAAETKVERAVLRVKQAKHDGSRSDSLNVSSDEEASDSLASSSVKTKASSSHKGPHQFSHLKLVQDIAVHVGAVWSMKFSHCGRLLATAGQNNIIWVWVLKEWYPFFNDMRRKYDSKERGAVFATPPRGSMEPPSSFDDEDSHPDVDQQMEEDPDAPFKSLPFSSYYGHTADVLDLAWSKNYFTLSSSMDKTVRLWHVSQKECLCCFQHIDFVTAISFHPKDDRYFLSGSLDGKLRLWNIPDKKVALWNEVSPDSSSNAGSGGSGALITTVNFCEGGKFAVCGTYDGRCLFYDTEHLKYHTQIHVRSSRGRNQKGRKITGIEPLPNEHKILVTSNDSRVRLYDLRDLSLTCKYKGLTNLSSQIKASFSQDNNFIICGSEDKSIYIWRTHLPPDVTKLSSFRRDRNDAWECIRAHNAVVTCAIFAPKPQKRNEPGSNFGKLRKSSLLASDNYVIISADFNGVIKIFAPT